MATTLGNLLRLTRAGIVLAQYGVRFVPSGARAHALLRVARWATLPILALSWPFRVREPKERRIAAALTRLGPSYIKLGQFLATRADLIGPELAGDLGHLHDKLPPFSVSQAREAVEDALGGGLEEHFAAFSPAIAAASIAQVHKAAVLDRGGRRDVAVKILRPGIEKRFRLDLDSFAFAARQIERFHPPSRRLRPTAVVDTLAHSVAIEMDLRLEAAAISEMSDNLVRQTSGDDAFRVPTVDWRRTAKRVLTLEWIDGIAISDHAALLAAGHDLKAIGLTLLRSFLRQAMHEGFFHADMHQGNLLIDKCGRIVAVDFGIMGRLGATERRFLAEILHGLITRDYRRVAAVHFEAGYVPPHHSVEVFAQAMRAIGEPIHGRTAAEISMADLLGQLFAYTEVFDMATRPELILLQKTMVVAEGVARSLDPELNIWSAAEPIAREWVERNYGVVYRLREAGEGAEALGRMMAEVPRFLEHVERATRTLADMTRRGLRIDDDSIERLAVAQAHRNRWTRRALFTGALALLAIAVWLLATLR